MNTQHLLSLGVGRDARFDFFGISSTGGWYDVEIQNDRKGATPSRAEYYSSLINASCLVPREFFDQLPEKFVIFITKTDYYKKGMAVYRFFDQYDKDSDTFMGSKVHYFYVNGQYQGDDAIGQLVHDFWCIKASEMSLSWLRERTQYLKETAEGLRHVSSLFDELRAEGEQKGDLKRMLETARRMIVKGCYASDEIVDISGLSHDKVQELLAQFNGKFGKVLTPLHRKLLK